MTTYRFSVIGFIIKSGLSASHQQKVYASCGFGVGIKFSFLNFVQPRGTRTRIENRSRHKLKRYL